MVKLKFHSHDAYDNGSLGLHLRRGDIFELDEQAYTKFRADLGEQRFRAGVEILTPKSKRTVKEYFRE